MSFNILSGAGGGNGVDVHLYMFEPTNFAVVDVTTKENGTRETLYQLIAGNALYPTTIRLGVYPVNKAGTVPSVNASIKVNTFIQQTEGTTITTLPCSAVIAWTMPWGAAPDNQQVGYLLQNLFSWLFPSVDAGVLSLDELAGLQFGITTYDLASITRTGL